MYDFIKKLPQYYKKSVVMQTVLSPLEKEFLQISEAIDNTEKQFFVLEADNTLARYESELGIVTNYNDSIEVRRSRILFRLRGIGTVTKEMFESVINLYVNGIVQIIEYSGESKIAIKFITRKGIPADMVDIQKAIEDIKPAHLAIEYIYTYRTWGDVKDYIGTWYAAKSYTWEGLSIAEIISNLNIVDGLVYYRPLNDGNATLIFDEGGKPYARLYEGG